MLRLFSLKIVLWISRDALCVAILDLSLILGLLIAFPSILQSPANYVQAPRSIVRPAAP